MTPSRVASAPPAQAHSTPVRAIKPPPLPATDADLLADADVLDAEVDTDRDVELLDADVEVDVDVTPMTYSHAELKVPRRPRRLVLLSAILVAVGSAGWLGVRGVSASAAHDSAARSGVAAAQLESSSVTASHSDGDAHDDADASVPTALAAKSAKSAANASKKKTASHPSKTSASRAKSSAKRPAAHAANNKKKASAQSSTKPRRASH